MTNDTQIDKIAAEAAGNICRKRDDIKFSEVEAIIKSVIEKALGQERHNAAAGDAKRRFAFKTRDGLIATDSCQDVDDDAPHIMRWLDGKMPHARRYDRTGEYHDGLPLYREYVEPPKPERKAADWDKPHSAHECRWVTCPQHSETKPAAAATAREWTVRMKVVDHHVESCAVYDGDKVIVGGLSEDQADYIAAAHEAALRAQRELAHKDCEHCRMNADELARQLKGRQQDTARLDWLEEEGGVLTDRLGYDVWCKYVSGNCTLREALDAAMQQEDADAS